jgi:hypothetical protein
MLRWALAACALAFTAPASASEIEGVWTGAYICTQGETGLKLTIEDGATPSSLNATFRFLPVATNPNVPDGVFSMRGTYDARSGAVALHGESWIVRPADYEMVDLTGALERTSNAIAISGQVHFPPAPEGCTSFRVLRDGK